jgi:two-component system sensor histidine kinase ArlS
MKIQHKLTLNSSLVFGLVFTVSSILLYLNFVKSAENVFFEELSRTASITALFYLEEDELSTNEYRTIEKKFLNATANQEIRLYDKQGKIHYGEADPDSNITLKILKTIRAKSQYSFKIEDSFYYAIYYRDNQGSFSVIIKAYNPTLKAQKSEFVKILVIALLIGMIVIVALSYSLSRIAYSPVRAIIDQVKNIDMTGQSHKLSYPQTKDELEALFKEFNAMLEKVYQHVQIQKNFISHASHELKSPLASIVGNLEVLLQKDRPLAEYQQVSTSVLNDAGRLENILQNLLVLSGLERDKKQTMQPERIDEIIWEVLDRLAIDYPLTKVNLHWELSEQDTDLLTYQGVKTQLYIVVYNLMENAAKFSSSRPVDLTLAKVNQRLCLKIKDEGIGISAKDLSHIFEPFYRGHNVTGVHGNGLGMAIAHKILTNHGIQISIRSEKGTGTEISLLF